jgi:HTH-type transcriptional regulator/antitoxin HigA
MKGKLEPKPIRCEADYDRALAEVELLWGAKLGTPEGDRLDILVTLIEAYEDKHYPMGVGPSGLRSRAR